MREGQAKVRGSAPRIEAEIPPTLFYELVVGGLEQRAGSFAAKTKR